MIGLHADCLAKAHELLEVVQADLQDAADIPFRMQRLVQDLETLYIKGYVFPRRGTTCILESC